jgi:glycosyltransferase involved in cell wall biosynthesis
VRIAVLSKQLSGHSRACYAGLRDQGAEVFLVCRSPTPDAPFADTQLDLGIRTVQWSRRPDERALRKELDRFRPDAVLVVSWDVGPYRRAARAMQGRTLRVLCMDNAWLGTAKQWGGRLISPLVIRPAYDVAFLPGERQAAFARHLGYPDDRILWGYYSCDHPVFAAVGHAARPEPPQAFVYVGRLVAEKGVDVLAEAYRLYRESAPDPWPLLVCGTGPLAGAFAGIPGVELLGFVQPDGLPEVFARSGCLVLPSRFEPWGVVIHEATAAGMTVVCTSACGASTRLVLDGYNGAVVPPDDPMALADGLSRMSAPHADRGAMSRRSAALASQFTPQRWAAYLIERTTDLRHRLGLDGT